jgi:hypothetical protein
MKYPLLICITTLLLFISCKKHQAANPYDTMKNTAAQNALLIEGDWIEDSLVITYDQTYTASPGSFLKIDSNLNYSFYEIAQGLSGSNSETGTITFQGDFFIKFNVGPNDFDPLRALFQISVATNHKLVLYGGGLSASVVGGIPIFYYHK